MKNVLALAALGAVSGKITLDIFNPRNFMNKNIAKTMLESFSNPVEQSLETGTVTWGVCADQEHKFTFDQSMTSYSPNPVVKNHNLDLNLGGTVSSTMHVSKIHVHVNWNNTPLYDQDVTVNKDFTSVLTEQIEWFVPSYAPSGTYDVTLTGYDTTQTDLCVKATMVL